MKLVKIENYYINAENITYLEKTPVYINKTRKNVEGTCINFIGENNCIFVAFNIEDVIAFIKSSLEAENN